MTGLSIYASFDSIYKKTGWETLSIRREVKINCYFFFYKIVNKEAPDYLSELVNYNLRNSHNIHVPFNRLSVYQNSYFPCILTPLTMVYRTHRHGILTPYSWYFYPPTMVYRPSYPCYFDPPIIGISIPYPWYFEFFGSNY